MPDPTRRARRWLGAGLALLLSVIGWWWAGPALLRVQVVAEVSGAGDASGWACEWVRRDNAERHGAWVEINDGAPEVLEVEPSGVAHDAGGPFEFWLYQVTADTEEKPDLVSLLDGPRTEQARGWVPFERGKGITYVGPGPGRIAVPLHGRCVQLLYARTARGGPVTVRYRGESVVIDTYSAAGTGGALLLPTGRRGVEAGELRQRLPVYRVLDAYVSWRAAPGGW